MFLPLSLSKGRHEFTIKVATRHPNPALSSGDRARAPERRACDRTAVRAAIAGRVRGVRARGVAAARGDVLGARQVMDGIDGRHRTAALLLALRANLLLTDPLQPGDAREDDARRLLLGRARARPQPVERHGATRDMTASNGRNKEAIAALRKRVGALAGGTGDRPRCSRRLLRQVALGCRGRHGRSQGVRKLVPDACAPMAAELDALRAASAKRKPPSVADAVSRCEARPTRATRCCCASGAGTTPGASSTGSPRSSHRRTAIRGCWPDSSWRRTAAIQAEIDRHIAALRALYPRSATGALEQIDQLAGP